ncbi:alpha/beta hydrolase [Chryseobacterium sp.]|uniref:alpha/beta fold hydrolase n=1 Tax=Chryseobacterium sp. TaxID=1871047 RepID=UPI0025C6574B|nr:alpha/beta hydrolase [Chryseobacterium sp.]
MKNVFSQLFCKALLLAAFMIVASVPVTSKLSAGEFPLPKGFKSEFKTINGVKMHYVKGGSGPLVFILHGFGSTWSEWSQVMPELAKKYTVVAPDLPGLGESGVAKSFQALDVADILYKLALENSGNQKFYLVAHDLGIWNSFPMLVQHQDKIIKAVYLEAPIPDDSLYQFPAFTPEGESYVWHFSFFDADEHLAERLIKGKERFFFEHFIRTHASNFAAFSPEYLDKIAKSYSKPHSLSSAFAYYRVVNQSVKDNKRLTANTKITIPMMAIGGGGIGFGTQQAEQTRKYATNVIGEVIPKCGHWMPDECPKPLTKLIVDFLAE